MLRKALLEDLRREERELCGCLGKGIPGRGKSLCEVPEVGGECWVCLRSSSESWAAGADGAVVRVVGDEARRIQSMKKTHSLYVMRDEDRSETSRRAFQRSRGRFHLITGDWRLSPEIPVEANSHLLQNAFQYICDSRHLLWSYG